MPIEFTKAIDEMINEQDFLDIITENDVIEKCVISDLDSERFEEHEFEI